MFHTECPVIGLTMWDNNYVRICWFESGDDMVKYNSVSYHFSFSENQRMWMPDLLPHNVLSTFDIPQL